MVFAPSDSTPITCMHSVTSCVLTFNCYSLTHHDLGGNVFHIRRNSRKAVASPSRIRGYGLKGVGSGGSRASPHRAEDGIERLAAMLIHYLHPDSALPGDVVRVPKGLSIQDRA